MNVETKNVSRETHEQVASLYTNHEKQLVQYCDQLLWWNQRVNLISRSINRTELLEHIKHCLYPIALELLDVDTRIVDSGTGGGLPGIPLAIARPDQPVLLNDIVQKKLFAAQQIARKLKLDHIDTAHCSLSELDIHEKDMLISKHAFKIPDLLNHISATRPSKIILYKGEDWKSEIETVEDGFISRLRSFKLDSNTTNSFYQGKVILELNLTPAHEQRRTSP
ncbi:MAG: 16S rRNA (guanine(527)-N(7))-methyltransferase RsmG [Bacteroidota bacterium]